jgi:hypothetical protein
MDTVAFSKLPDIEAKDILIVPKYREEVHKDYKTFLCRYSRNNKAAFVVGARAWLSISASPSWPLKLLRVYKIDFLLALS